MQAEPAPLSPSFPKVLPPTRLGRPERVALIVLALLSTLLLAAWQIPPLLDWSHYRGTIATYAASRLGRPVSIAGGVRLSLLPRPMLLADRVSLADRGDGVSAEIGTLRLEVALSSLLIGHVVPRTLALDDAQVRLPWPPPHGTAAHLPAHVTGAFAATVSGGALAIGGMTLRDVTASLRTDPDTGAFAAEGNARVAGLPWRFTAVLGAPGTAGISPLNLTLDGRPAPSEGRRAPDMQGTGGSFHGHLLADGTMQGALMLRGPDLSRLGGGPALAWQTSGPVTVDGPTIRAPALDLRMAQAAGRAAVAVHLGAPAWLSVQAHISELPAGAWMWRLLQGASSAGYAAKIDVAADTINLPATRLQAAHLQLTANRQGSLVDAASVTLPGGTRMALTGAIQPDGAFAGTMGIEAPRLHDTLAWLAGAALPLPPGVLSTAKLHGALTLTPARLTWSALGGQIDGGPITGAIASTLAIRPAVDIALSTPHLPLAGWAWPSGQEWPALAAVLAPFARADATLALAAGQIDWPGLPLHAATLQAVFSPAGITLRRLAAERPGGHLEASAILGADASISQARLDLTATEAAALPTFWHVPSGLFQSGLHLGLTAAGPSHAIALALRADLGDLRAEAEGHLDGPARALEATATLRHPGAPRLLAALGVTDARNWLDEGSFAMLTHVSVRPGQVRARDFSVSAGALQVEGALEATLGQADLRLRGEVTAPRLALPGTLSGALGWDWLRGLDAQIKVKADRVLVGLDPVASNASATFLASGGVAVMGEGRASLSAGHVAGAVAFDMTQDPPAVSLLAQADGMSPDVILPQPPSPPGLELQGGSMDVSADLFGHGRSTAAVTATTVGHAAMSLHGVGLLGLDMQAAGAALTSPGSGTNANLQQAMSTGVTTPLDGNIEAQVTGGVANLKGSRLTGPPGAVDVDGTADGTAGRLDLHLAILPAGVAGPGLRLGLSGPFDAARSAVEFGSATPVKTPHLHHHRLRHGK